MTAYGFSSLEGKDMRIGAETEELLASLRRAAELARAVEKSHCVALREDESDCDGVMHHVPSRRMSRHCRLRHYREERRRLAGALGLCGYPPDADEVARPISPALMAAVDRGRPVYGLGELMAALPAIDAANGGHLVLIGTVGTVKTHVLLALYFSALYRGRPAFWLTSKDLRDVAKDLDSFDEEVRAAAQTRLQGWQKRPILFLDDLGDRKTEGFSADAGSTRLAALLLDLLGQTTARLLCSSNLDSLQLAKHPDYGQRAVSRLFADHVVYDPEPRRVPCRIFALGGPDQRQHGWRSAQGAG